MYLAQRGGLSEIELTKIIQSFNMVELPQMQKRYNYYRGKQQILEKQASDIGRPNNQVVANYVESIIDKFEGYALGIPVEYQSSVDISAIEEVLNYNDVVDEDSEFFRKGLIFGRAPEICYLDEEAKLRFRTLDPREIIPVYENNLNNELIYCIRIWSEQLSDDLTPKYYIQVWDDNVCKTYTSAPGFTSAALIDEKPHFFNQVPITIFNLNEEETGAADSIFNLQDAYNRALSNELDEQESFAQAYLVLKGLDAEVKDLEDMKRKKALIMDTDCDAYFLTKNAQTAESEHLLTTLEDKIYEISCCPNFASDAFGTSSGIAIKFRMLGMENKVTGMLNNFRKALQRRIELLAGPLSLISGEQAWRDIEIIFTRSIPAEDVG